MAAHTPGPWVRDGTLVGPSGIEIDLRLDDEGENWVSVKGDDDATVEANAHLIAAAPNLLDAAQAAHDLLGLSFTGHVSASSRRTSMMRLRSAIAKAGGAS